MVIVQAPAGSGVMDILDEGRVCHVEGGGTVEVSEATARNLVAFNGFDLVVGFATFGDGTRTPLIAPREATVRAG